MQVNPQQEHKKHLWEVHSLCIIHIKALRLPRQVLVAKAGYPAVANKATWNTFATLLNQNRGSHTDIKHRKKLKPAGKQYLLCLVKCPSTPSLCYLLPQLHTAGSLERCGERSCCLTLTQACQVPRWVRQSHSLLSALYGCPGEKQRKNWGRVLTISGGSYFCFFLLSKTAITSNSLILLRIVLLSLPVLFLSVYT